MNYTTENIPLEQSLKYSYQRRNGLNALYLSNILLNNNFKSLKREVIFSLHLLDALDLKEKNSKDITEEELFKIMFNSIGDNIKIKKGLLYKIVGLKKDKFREYFKPLGFTGRKSFNVEEVYQILTYWSGDNNWGILNSFLKQEMANLLSGGNLDNLDIIMSDFFINKKEGEKYKNYKKFPPTYLKEILKKEDYKFRFDIYDKEFYLDSLLVVYLTFLWNIFDADNNPKLQFLFSLQFWTKISKENQLYKLNKKMNMMEEEMDNISKKVRKLS